jgi:lipopolysaccharide transport system permease protein
MPVESPGSDRDPSENEGGHPARAYPRPEAHALTVIRPAGRWQRIDVGELWRFRELIGFLAWRDVKVRYKQTLLGAAWAVLQPALMMVVFTIFLGRLAGVPSGDVTYPLFAYAGLLPWSFFATAVANAGNSVVGSERLVTKVYFPRLAIPFAAVGAAVVDFVVALGLLILMVVYYRVRLSPGMLLVPVIFAPIVLTAMGVGTLLAALNVSYRDFRYVLPFLVQLWMFATPTVYMQVPDRNQQAGNVAEASASPNPPVRASSSDRNSAPAQRAGREVSPVGPWLRTVLDLNPMTGLIGAFRAAVLGWPIPWTALSKSSVSAVVILLVGCLYFRKVEEKLADII